jgi:glycosyltransferase involved in cell wall biosynthesis
MYRDHSVGVVVPAYNEEGLIGGVIEDMPAFVDVIYPVDDCSTDGTWDEILATARRDASADQPGSDLDSPESPKIRGDGGLQLSDRAAVYDSLGRVTPIQHRENRGAGGAIKTGYMAALEDEVALTVTVDGDGQMDLSQMSRLLDPLVEGEADYAKGNRLLYQKYRTEMPKFRFLGNSILTFLTKVASGYWKMMDPQNGYTAISHYALKNVGIGAMYEYYGYCNDLLVKLNAKGMRIADVGIPAVYGDEESSISYSRYIRKVSWMLLKDFLWRLKVKYLVLDFHPLALFYYFGAAMVALGALGGGWSLYAKFVMGDQLFVRATSSLLLFSMGSMFVMFAMLFDMQVNQDKETQIMD